jgi:hypothetical protein
VRALITILGDKPPILVDDGIQLDDALRDAANEARTRGKLGAILIEAANKNCMTMVVGTTETVLSFDYAHRNPPYYASKGNSSEDEPVMTCYLSFAHHTEFPRKFVIPLMDGIAAVKEFVDSGELPTCITWEEV